MIKKFEDIIKEFEGLGYSYNYFPNSHVFELIKSRDDDGWVIDSLNVDYIHKFIRFDGSFDKQELNLIKKLIEKLESKDEQKTKS